MIHPELVDYFKQVIKAYEFIKKYEPDVRVRFLRGLSPESKEYKRQLVFWIVKIDRDYMKIESALRAKSMFSYDFLPSGGRKSWEHLYKLSKGENKRAELQILTHQAKELVSKIDFKIENILDKNLINEIKIMISKLSEASYER